MTDPIILPPSTPADSLIVPDAPAPAPEPVAPPAPAEETFSRSYVEDLRKEAANYRTQAQEARQWSELFEGFEDDESREAAAEIVRLAKSGDPDAARQVVDLFSQQLPKEPAYVTQAELDAKLSEREQAAAEKAAIDDVYRQAEGLGYQRDSREMTDVLWYMTRGGKSTLQEAHEAVQADKQRYIDEYLESKKQTSRESARQPAQQGSPANTRTAPKTPAEARAAALARIQGA